MILNFPVLFTNWALPVNLKTMNLNKLPMLIINLDSTNISDTS